PPEELQYIEARARELGALRHLTIDARDVVYRDHISYLIKGNIRRGSVYPLCVGAERVVQARVVAEVARQLDAGAIAHGSTGAGKDQIRFDVAIRALCPQMEILTPVRDEEWSREASAAYLAERGVPVSTETRDYSINEGLWGVTIGGKETHDTAQVPPDEAYVWTVPPGQAPAEGATLTVTFDQGLPVALNGESLDGVSLVTRLNQVGAAHGVGRGIHVGDTILGIKGRIAFEAPAAAILLDAHRELEKLVLTRWQGYWKEQLSSFYGMLLHEAQYFDPVMRDLEAFLDSSQQVVTGDVKVHLRQGALQVLGVTSEHSMMHAAAGTYGERNALWSPEDARGFCTIYGTQSLLAMQARGGAATSTSSSPSVAGASSIEAKVTELLADPS
ncbi:MAG: argininosuccinate synthase, partial [Myxococcota bacterium]